MIPGTFAYVYAGSIASGAADGTQFAIKVAGAVLAIGVTFFVARVATRAIRSAGVDEAAAPSSPG
jgi:uncharacterized membrane protein YdjX (TVP38/TMEM64 family)